MNKQKVTCMKKNRDLGMKFILVGVALLMFISGYQAGASTQSVNDKRECVAGTIQMIDDRFYKCKEIEYNG